jgi:hypothetical protein
MSINTLITNTLVINELESVVGGGGGGTVSASLPLVVSFNNISLPIDGSWTEENNVVKGSSSNSLIWGTDNGGGGAVSATLPLTVSANDIQLPISGEWSESNNVVKGSSATALMWGTDSGGGGGGIDTINSLDPILGNIILTTNSTNAMTISAGAPTNTVLFSLTVVESINCPADGLGPVVGPITFTGAGGITVLSDANANITFSGSGGGAVSATLPLTVSANDIQLPISGEWSESNNVVKGSSATALMWGTDSGGGGGSAPIFTDLSLPISGDYFNNTSNIGLRQVLITDISTTYIPKGDPTDFPTATIVINVEDFPDYTINIPLNFPLLTPTYLPGVATNLNTPTNMTSVWAIITGTSPTNATFFVQIRNLQMNIGDQIIFYFPQFTLYNGQ